MFMSGRLRRIAAMLTCAAALVLSGCGISTTTREGLIRHDGVYVFHAPGISGEVPHDHYFAMGLLRAGVQEVYFVDWTTPWAGKNLTDTALHEKEATRLVQRLRGFKATSPEARVVLTGHSGGASIIIRAAELFDVGENIVEQVWLLAPALSPDYDFGPALERVPRIVAFSSPHDGIILGAGTSLFGTSDRYFGSAGGRVGFNYDHPRFEQWGYDPAWLEFRNTGDHLQVLSQRFSWKVIGPSMLHYLPQETPGGGVNPPKGTAAPTQGEAWEAQPVLSILP